MAEILTLWSVAPGNSVQIPTLTYYKSECKSCDSAALIFPGGAYNHFAEHEGKSYALFLNSLGMDAFVLEYRIDPAKFPLALIDARRAMRYIRYNAERFEIDPHKIVVMGSSAGGNLASLLCTCDMPFDDVPYESDEIDSLDCYPNAQILCYPYVCMNDPDHSIEWLHDIMFGKDVRPYAMSELDPISHVNDKTPPAFFTHNADDTCVDFNNSFKYASALKNHGISTELHIFPFGNHGIALANEEGRINPHVAQWGKLLENWLRLLKFIK